MSLNGQLVTSSLYLSRRCAFVPQIDSALSQLTVREAIEFAACFQLSKNPFKYKPKVDACIKEFGLTPVEHQRIGSNVPGKVRGISGGQLKRVNVATQGGYVNKKKIIFFDEATTGLSTSDTVDLINVTKRLCQYVFLNIFFIIMSIYLIFLSCTIYLKANTILKRKTSVCINDNSPTSIVRFLRIRQSVIGIWNRRASLFWKTIRSFLFFFC